MRLLAASLILVLLAGGGIIETANARQAKGEPKNVNVELSIKVDSHKFCSGDADGYSELFDLTTRYTNKGKFPLTITIFSGTNGLAATRIAQTVDDMKAAKYESEQAGDSFLVDGGWQSL
jgi:hypothetical protein